MKELFEDVDREKAAREATAKKAKDKTKATKNAEKRAATVEEAKVLVEKRSVKLETK